MENRVRNEYDEAEPLRGKKRKKSAFQAGEGSLF